MPDDTAKLVVALSAQLTKFEKDMQSAVKVADTNTKAIETRFSQMNTKIEQEFSSFISRYSAAAGPLGGVLGALGPVGTTIAAGLGAAVLAFTFLSQKTDEYIQKQRDLKEASETTGLTIGQLQAIKTAARESGVEFDKAVAGITRMLVEIQKLREKGTGPLADSLDKLKDGLADQVIAAKSPGEAVDILAKVLEDASTNFEKAGLAAEIFGKRGLDNIRVLQQTLSRGGLAVIPDISDEEKNFTKRLIDLDNEVKETQKRIDASLGKLFSEQMRQNQLQFWKDTEAGLKAAQEASAWFGGFLQQIREYIASKQGVQDTTEALDQDRIGGTTAGTRGVRARVATTTTEPTGLSVITDPYATTKVQFDVTAQMKSLQGAIDAAVKSTTDSLGEQDAAFARNLNFIQRWAGVLGDAIKPQEQLYIQQLKVTEAVKQYSGEGPKAVAIQEAGNRATAQLIATQTIAANNLRERLLLLSEEEIVQNKLAQARLEAQKAGLANVDLTRTEIVIRKQARETIDAQAAALSKLPEATRYSQQAMDLFKNADQSLVSFAGNFESAMGDIATSSKTAAEAFKSLADSIIRDLVRMTIRMTITGPLLKAITGLFGGAPGSVTGAPAIPNIFSRQGGGPVASGRPYVVGEHGTELFVPSSSGQIVPGSVSRAGTGGSQVVINNYTAADTQVNQQRQSDGFNSEKLVIDIVKKAQARGDLDDSNRGRFALRPMKVR